jgi:hypothetical protein
MNNEYMQQISFSHLSSSEKSDVQNYGHPLLDLQIVKMSSSGKGT